jgi:endonuclease/exonuclease/phosphatase family metal-dependent hydrolase
MTRNLYLGADLTPVLEATTPQAFGAAVFNALTQISANDFPSRAEQLAAEIAERRPHVVALQEVYQLTLDGSGGAPPLRDYLSDLLIALEARGASYYVAGQVFNLDVQIPLPGLGVVRALDRDVILARSDTPTAPVVQPPDVCRQSGEGCNFRIVAALDSPVGRITIERGFVVVDAFIGAQTVRVVNTHLEVPELPRAIQAAQAAELLALIHASSAPEATVVITGDINSAPDDSEIPTPGEPIVPPYLQLVQAGFTDLWLLRPGEPIGSTCCQASDLSNAESQLFKRVDVAFANRIPVDVRMNTVGADVEDKAATGLWPSDHAGVVARVTFEP